MKTFLAVGVWLMAAVVSVLAQGNRADPPQPRVTERGLHHRVWETVIWQEDMFGETRPQTHRFTELATGMHTVRDGEFVPASDELEITATGARASKALHGVEILGNLRSLGAIRRGDWPPLARAAPRPLIPTLRTHPWWSRLPLRTAERSAWSRRSHTIT